MYRFFVGIDVSKDVIDTAVKETDQVEYLGQFKNDDSGFKKMLKELIKVTSCKSTQGFFCFENTGIYSKSLLEFLISQQIPCREENPIQIKRSMGLKRGKNDKVDAQCICLYVFEKRDTIKPSKIDKPLIVKLKKLLSRRNLLVKQKVALELSVKESAQMLDPQLKDFIMQQNQSLLTIYRNQIKEVESEIEKTINQDNDLSNTNDLIQSIKGIGPIIGAYLIAFTDNFSRFDDARKFACYCGIAPFPNQSGKFIGKSNVSHFANKKIKSLLSNAVPVAVRYDPQIKRYKQAKLNEGKAKGIIVNNIKNKLLQRVFAVVKRQSPYVILQ